MTLSDALSVGDVASVILPQYGLDDSSFQTLAERLIPVVQNRGAAALIAGEERIAARAGADGLHGGGGTDALSDAIERFSPRLIVGGGRARERHAALEIGELQPDYTFFGWIDGDIKDEPHGRTSIWTNGGHRWSRFPAS